MKVTTIVPWFGSDRMVAERYAKPLKGLKWIGIPFGGGMSIVPHLDARSIVVNDLHRHIINLANVLKDPYMGVRLIRRLKREAFHPESHSDAQEWCKRRTERPAIDCRDIEAARCYFVSQWMGRSGKSGIDDEFNGGLSVRWNANGGDSNTRYRSAVSSLNSWRNSLQRCNFACVDCFDFLGRCEDNPAHGIYADPPWFDDGDRYRHSFTIEQHEQLAKVLHGFSGTRVVVRLGIHKQTERLYPRDRWQWTEIVSRTQGNNAKAEVMLINVARRQPALFPEQIP